MSEMLNHLLKALPLLAVISAICGFIGWWFRGSGTTKAATAKPSAAPEKLGQDRAKNLEAALEKSKAANKSLKAELEELKSASVAHGLHEKALAELETAKQSLAGEARRAASLEADLKKSQDNIKVLNSRANEADKAQKDRGFALQNELSKTREELAVLQNRPDNSAGLESEIERLRESVASATRYAGELRKREALAMEEMEKVKTQLAQARESGTLAPAPKIGPVGDSDRVAAAKAEVLRLLEENKRKTVSPVAPVTAIAPVIGIVAASLAEIEPEPEPKVEVETVEPPASALEAPEPAIEDEVVTESPAPVDQEAPVEQEPVNEPEAQTPAQVEPDTEENESADGSKKAPPGELFVLE